MLLANIYWYIYKVLDICLSHFYMETGLLIKNDSQWPCYPELRKLEV